MKQDWYRQTTWNAEIESMFFTKLSRARKWNAPQYLRIQAGLLLYASSDYFPSALMLTNKLFDEYLVSLEIKYKSHVEFVDFRPKNYGWENYSIYIKMRNKKARSFNPCNR